MVKDAAEAARVVADLRRGANFAAVARERSLDESRQAGGYLGPIARNYQTYPEVAARAFAITLNTVSEPFPAKGGYAIIKVSKRDAARQPAFDEIKDRIKNTLMQRQHDQRFQELIATLKGKYPVTIDERALAAAGQQKDMEQ
jgi:parvulin-like peptidyl-prolyl isomerase